MVTMSLLPRVRLVDETRFPEIHVYMRILYSAVCRHGSDDAGSLSDIAAAVVPHLKAIKHNCAIEVACAGILCHPSAEARGEYSPCRTRTSQVG